MPVHTYRVETDKGSYDVEVDIPDNQEPSVVSKDEPSTYWSGALKGAKEGMLGGAKGFAEGILPGIKEGVTSLATLPISVAIEAASMLFGEVGIGALAGDPVGTSKKIYDNISNIPGNMRDRVKEALDLAAKDPEAFGKMVGQYTAAADTSIGLGGAAAKLGRFPATRRIGSTMETMGREAKFPIRLMGAHQLFSGNLMGLATLATPPLMQKGGAKLRAYGESDPKFHEANNPSGGRNIDVKGPIKSLAGSMKLGPSTGEAANRVPIVGTPAEASGRVQKVMAQEAKQAARPSTLSVDEQIADAQTQADIKASDVAAREAKLRAEQETKQATETAKADAIARRRAEAGVVAQPAKYGTSQRGTTPEGVVESESTSYAKPKTPTVEDTDPTYNALKQKFGQETADNYRRKKLEGITQQARTERPPIQADPKSVETLNQPQQGAIRLGRPAQEPVPATKTKSSPISEVNPELTVDEEKAFGLPPGTRINKLAPDVKAKLLARRAERSAAYRMNAGMDKGARLASDLDEP